MWSLSVNLRLFIWIYFAEWVLNMVNQMTHVYICGWSKIFCCYFHEKNMLNLDFILDALDPKHFFLFKIPLNLPFSQFNCQQWRKRSIFKPNGKEQIYFFIFISKSMNVFLMKKIVTKVWNILPQVINTYTKKRI